ncbi:MAG: 2-C-methyl-D-erythritol 4-phosphate cytidylyltransferase [Desulfotalea sp.]
MKDGAVIIPAAGRGTRMKLKYPKQYLDIAGAPILIHTIKSFVDHPCISEIVVVVPKSHINESKKLIKDHNLNTYNIKVVGGGKRRQDSVLNGLNSLAPSVEIVLVHDGARPLVDHELISNCYQTAKKNGAAIAAIPVKDTIKRQTDLQEVKETVPRDDLWQAQTPQAAKIDLLKNAFAQNGNHDVTDESALLEKAGIPVTLVEGSDVNIKITRPADIVLATAIMNENKPQMKIGHGYDAHRLTKDRKLILGGVNVPYHLGLAGHSDADVLTHALCDALLGAIGAGDIGQHFPDSSAEFKDIYSISLLESVFCNVQKQGYQLSNADISIICQAPKLAKHLPTMQDKLAKACQTKPANINIKATTTEKMGFPGRGEGISCHAVVLIEKIS